MGRDAAMWATGLAMMDRIDRLDRIDRPSQPSHPGGPGRQARSGRSGQAGPVRRVRRLAIGDRPAASAVHPAAGPRENPSTSEGVPEGSSPWNGMGPHFACRANASAFGRTGGLIDAPGPPSGFRVESSARRVRAASMPVFPSPPQRGPMPHAPARGRGSARPPAVVS